MVIIFSNTACTVVRSTTVWTTTRSLSSVVNTPPSPAHPTLEYSTDGKKLKVISNVHPLSKIETSWPVDHKLVDHKSYIVPVQS